MVSLADSVDQTIACLNVYVAQLNLIPFIFAFLYLIKIISLGKLCCVLILCMTFDLLIKYLCIRVLTLFDKIKISTSVFFYCKIYIVSVTSTKSIVFFSHEN